MNSLYPAVADRANFRCEYCRAPEEAFNFPFEVEHVRPLGRGGTDDLSNLALSCRACNSYKSLFESALDSQTGDVHPLYNPRTQVWEEHFAVDPLSGQVSGRTPAGRATILRLKTNEARQCRARLRWIRFGLFP